MNARSFIWLEESKTKIPTLEHLRQSPLRGAPSPGSRLPWKETLRCRNQGRLELRTSEVESWLCLQIYTTWVKCSLSLDHTNDFLALHVSDAVVKAFVLRSLAFIIRHREALQSQVEESEPALTWGSGCGSRRRPSYETVRTESAAGTLYLTQG